MLDFCTTFGGHITLNQILSRKKVCRQELGGFCGSYFQKYHVWIMRDAISHFIERLTRIVELAAMDAASMEPGHCHNR